MFEQLDNDDDSFRALAQLGVTETISDPILFALGTFVCELYIHGIKQTNVADVRWNLFRLKQAQAESMPQPERHFHPSSPELSVKL